MGAGVSVIIFHGKRLVAHGGKLVLYRGGGGLGYHLSAGFEKSNLRKTEWRGIQTKVTKYEGRSERSLPCARGKLAL